MINLLLHISAAFLASAIHLHGLSEITIDQSDANAAPIQRVGRSTPGFRTFRCTHLLIAQTLTMRHTIRQAQLDVPENQPSPAASQFYFPAYGPADNSAAS